MLSSAHVLGGHYVNGFFIQILVILFPHELAAHTDTHLRSVSCWAKYPSGQVFTHIYPTESPNVPCANGQIFTQDFVEFYLNLNVPTQFITHWPP